MARVRMSGSSMLSEFKVSTPCAAVTLGPADSDDHDDHPQAFIQVKKKLNHDHDLKCTPQAKA